MITRYMVGIDDTDDLDSRGTGYRARQLGDRLAENGVEPLGVTRHQLLVDPRIPYTSHNSSACLDVRSSAVSQANLMTICREFLKAHSAPGSDVGLCVAAADSVAQPVIDFGGRAKREIVTEDEATRLAAVGGLQLEPLTGSGLGVIGALAAVGLRAGGHDGRFLWLPGLREMSGVHQAASLRRALRLDAIETEDGRQVGDNERVALGDWPRPLLREGRSVLLVEEVQGGDYEWIVAVRDRLKQLSD